MASPETGKYNRSVLYLHVLCITPYTSTGLLSPWRASPSVTRHRIAQAVMIDGKMRKDSYMLVRDSYGRRVLSVMHLSCNVRWTTPPPVSNDLILLTVMIKLKMMEVQCSLNK